MVVVVKIAVDGVDDILPYPLGRFMRWREWDDLKMKEGTTCTDDIEMGSSPLKR
jgi:hypothetical protein